MKVKLHWVTSVLVALLWSVHVEPSGKLPLALIEPFAGIVTVPDPVEALSTELPPPSSRLTVAEPVTVQGDEEPLETVMV